MAAPVVTIRTKASRQQVLLLVRAFPGLLHGRSRSMPVAVQTLLNRLGLATLELIHTAFMQKANGQADASGSRWPPLAPRTVRLKQHTAPANARQILREFDYLQNSLRPSMAAVNAGPIVPQTIYQIFERRPGSILLGTSRPHAGAHHRGLPGKLPQRRLWPAVRRWPRRWWQYLLQQLRSGSIRVLTEFLRGRP